MIQGTKDRHKDEVAIDSTYSEPEESEESEPGSSLIEPETISWTEGIMYFQKFKLFCSQRVS
jgi:hypothetical protein